MKNAKLTANNRRFLVIITVLLLFLILFLIKKIDFFKNNVLINRQEVKIKVNEVIQLDKVDLIESKIGENVKQGAFGGKKIENNEDKGSNLL